MLGVALPGGRRERYDVAVIGGGIVGLASALELQTRGRSVVVIDPGKPRIRSSFGNAGVISRGSIFPVAAPGLRRKLLRYAANRDPAVRLRYRSLPALLPWCARFVLACDEGRWRAAARSLDPLVAAALPHHERLARLLGSEGTIRRTGWLKLYRSPAALAAAALERAILAEHEIQAVHLSTREIADLEPSLAPRFSDALFFPQTASIRDPGALVERCYAALLARGGIVVKATAQAIESADGAVRIASTAGTIAASHAVIAAGAWSGPIAAALGYRFPLVAERGYYRRHALPDGVALKRPVHDTGGGYVLAPADDGVRLLSGIELARPDDPANPVQLDLLVEDARKTLVFGARTAEDTWMGPRPATPDGLPVIGRAPGRPQIVFAFGHGHIGFSTGPVTGFMVADLVSGHEPAIDLAAFSPQRLLKGASGRENAGP